MEPFRHWPKAELHVHLEGSVRPDMLLELAPGLNLEQVQQRYRFRGFAGFVEAFKWVTSFLRTPDDYAFVADRLLAQLETEGVRYAEITLSVGVMLWRGLNPVPIYDALEQVRRRHPQIDVWWIFDAVRHFGPEAAWPVVKLAADRATDRVVAFGLGGDETRGPAHWFRPLCSFARRHGLGLTLHAGEMAGPRSIWQAIECGARRIGHGIRAIEDPELVTYLREHRIALEICLTSNLRTGAVSNLEAHPLRRLYDAGVPVVLNTDDPGLFETTLSQEYALAADRLGFTLAELQDLAAKSFHYGFRYSPLQAEPYESPGVIL